MKMLMTIESVSDTRIINIFNIERDYVMQYYSVA